MIPSSPVLSPRFGEVAFEAEDVVTFEEGLIGFLDYHQFVVMHHKPDSPFRWLLCLEAPEFAVLVVDPLFYLPDYAPKIDLDDCKEVGLDASTPGLLFATAAIPPGRPQEMTLNLLGPILINPSNRQAKQVVLGEGTYTTKYRVFSEQGTSTTQAA